MKCDLRLACVLALGAWMPGQSARAGASQPLPTPYPELRYREMSARSPFAVATAPTAAAAPTPGFAAQLYIDGVAHVGVSDFVAIKSRDTDKGEAVLVAVGQSTQDGVKVERVRWSDEMGKSTVEVSKGAEKATLIFDEAQVRNAPDSVAPIIAQAPGFPGIRRAQIFSTPLGQAPVPQPVLPQTQERGMTPQGPISANIPVRVSRR